MSKSSLLCFLLTLAASQAAPEAAWFRDFVGVNGHTVTFKPELFAPVCRIVRDYHPVEWDLAGDTSVLPDWPFAKNKVSWEAVYGSWQKAGLRTSACLQIDGMKDQWKDLEHDAHAYAASFAAQFGPGGKWPLVDWVELGNEPGLYDDATYTRLFKALATGIREGNPQLKIVTCNVESEHSDRYWKGASVFADSPELYDVLQIHRYAIAEGWPVWRRSYPEDPQVPFLSAISNLLKWRDAHAPSKPLWVSEFGWDSSTQPPDPKGEFAKWIGSTDAEQARYLVRSFLLFAEMGVAKAFVYFHNDKDEPKLHAASGLTRNYQPKPAYHAVAWMLGALLDYRFSKVVAHSLTDGYAYEFSPENASAPSILAVWHPTQEEVVMKIPLAGRRLVKAECMPLTPVQKEGPEETARLTPAANVTQDAGNDNVSVRAGQRPIFLWLQ